MDKILVIDDDKNFALGLSSLFAKHSFEVKVEHEGLKGLISALAFAPDVILLDVNLPFWDGFQVMKIFKNYQQLANTPVILVSATAELGSVEKGLSLGSFDYITKPFNPRLLILKVENILKRVKTQKDLLNKKLLVSKETTVEEMLFGLVRALETRMYDEDGHSERLVKNAVRLAELVDFPGSEIDNLRRGACLHDIGKIGIPDEILFKSGELTAEERKVMERHPLIAKKILENIEVLEPVMDVPLYHHEHFDGSGYPYQLKGKAIPLPARVFTIIDVFDALRSDRPYRPAFLPHQAKQIIMSERKNFDPEILEVFLSSFDDFLVQKRRDRF
jgi:putative two-component system response regulator